MADVRVIRGSVADGRIRELVVNLPNIPERTLDRATALRWMRDGHSFVPVVGGVRRPALQLVEVGDEHFIRNDHQPVAEDTLPDLS